MSGLKDLGMKSKKISRIHGGGGEAMNELLSEILSEIKNKSVKGGIGLREMDDSATIPLGDRNIVFTTDSYTVRPLFFPGGDIGKLSICGTINDLAVMGAKPIAISTAFIIGDGFSLSDLKRIMKSINRISEETNTPVVTGDTKVIEDRIGLLSSKQVFFSQILKNFFVLAEDFGSQVNTKIQF